MLYFMCMAYIVYVIMEDVEEATDEGLLNEGGYIEQSNGIMRSRNEYRDLVLKLYHKRYFSKVLKYFFQDSATCFTFFLMNIARGDNFARVSSQLAPQQR